MVRLFVYNMKLLIYTLPVFVIAPNLLVYVPDVGNTFVYVFFIPMDDAVDILTKPCVDVDEAMFHNI